MHLNSIRQVRKAAATEGKHEVSAVWESRGLHISLFGGPSPLSGDRQELAATATAAAATAATATATGAAAADACDFAIRSYVGVWVIAMQFVQLVVMGDFIYHYIRCVSRGLPVQFLLSENV
ncbi:hypothetical protein Efla_007128 [Eimeria flavescens]